MSKITHVLFALNTVLLLVCVALMIPIAWWQWAITLCLSISCARGWQAERGQGESADSMWDRFDDGRAPRYIER